MVQEKVINLLSDFLYVSEDELDEKTNLTMEYLLNELDVKEIINELNITFEINIDETIFEELQTIEDIIKYIENIL